MTKGFLVIFPDTEDQMTINFYRYNFFVIFDKNTKY